ncbi:hypothetical protein IFM89_032294 [Coptis chinensis]|uniref:Uncharacterized protein n=1 Tax=Coptis chinensis TaxID=261450 RepID=A0A835H0G6_9MAGN|nr:hypothetical protein IFM89_032294 [Coptis chinensis]
MRSLSILEASHFMDDSILVIGVQSDPTVAEEKSILQVHIPASANMNPTQHSVDILSLARLRFSKTVAQSDVDEALSKDEQVGHKLCRCTQLDLKKGEGKSVYVRNLSSTISAFDLEQEWKKFGEIKPEGVVIRTCKLMPRSLAVDIATIVPTAIVSGNCYSFPHGHYQWEVATA